MVLKKRAAPASGPAHFKSYVLFYPQVLQLEQLDCGFSSMLDVMLKPTSLKSTLIGVAIFRNSLSTTY